MCAKPAVAKDPEIYQVKVLLGKANYPEKSKDSDEIQRQLDYLVIRKEVSEKPATVKQLEVEEIEHKFARLAEQWYEETLFSSDYLEKILHPAYQRIIGLGRKAIPLILNELQDMPNDWFWALRALTEEGEDPVTPEYAGQPEEMAKAWLNWGRENQII